MEKIFPAGFNDGVAAQIPRDQISPGAPMPLMEALRVE